MRKWRISDLLNGDRMESNTNDSINLDKVVQCIRDHPEGITNTAIAKLTGISYAQVYRAIISISYSYPLAEETVSRNEIKYFMIEAV